MIKKGIKLLVFTLLMIILPVKVHAAGFGITPSATQVKMGQEVTFSVWTDTTFGTTEVTFSYDPNQWDYVSVTSAFSIVPNPTAGNIKAVVSNTDLAGVSGTFMQVTLRSKLGSGSSSVSVSSSSTYNVSLSDTIAMNSGNVGITHFTPSSNANLKNLSVGTCTLAFDPNVLEYTCPEIETSSVMVTAIAADDTAQIKGHGNVNLAYGANALKIVVTAADGTQKTYTVNISRKDNRSSDSKLSALTVSEGSLQFDSGVYEYNLSVESSIEKITIEATAEKSTSTVAGTGEKTLSVGANRFEILVTAENGGVSTYVINIQRQADGIASSTMLTKLSYNGVSLDPSKLVHSVGAYEDQMTLDLVYETSSPTSTFEVKGNEDFKPGINIVTITVNDVEVSPVVYTIVVYKPGEIENYYTSKNIEVAITESMLQNSNFSYAVLNSYEGLRFLLKFDSNIVKAKERYYVVNASKNPYTLYTNVPKGTEIEYVVDEAALNDKTFYLYGLDDKNKYVLINDKLKIENFMLKFTSEGYNEYIILEDKIEDSEVVVGYCTRKERVTNKLFGFGLGVAFSGLCVLGYVLVKKRMNYKK